MKSLRVAIVHDWLTGMRGGERCLELLAQTYPDAPIATLIHKRAAVSAAMLDVPIMSRGKVMGVTCYEHVGGARRWDADDERFAYAMASFVAFAFDRISSSPPPRP